LAFFLSSFGITLRKS